ncbi:hypothetical protein SSX86_007433 [Deinandra increscens subsp. villosa]|uniref:Uncharacterized protein n=1 Tax=Deinandra increscens subsp. villosa TaxID=3103831 RepID=A0AAP0H7W9_9ASTR
MLNFMDSLKMIHAAGIVENYALVMLIVYLTDVWGSGIIQAFGWIKMLFGITKAMPFAILFLMDHNYIGSYSMLIISTTASALGMGFLSISTPSWLYTRITGSCGEYKMKCISETQLSLFYWALILILIGRSARQATMETLNFKGNANERELKKHFVTSGSYFAVLHPSLLVFAPWSIIFGISSICSSLAVFLLMGKSWSHKLYINKPERSPVTSVLRVFMATILKINQKLPYESAFLFKEIDQDNSSLRGRSSLRFLEKAAIEPPNGKGRRLNRWTLCNFQEVEDAKTLVRMLPVGLMFAFLVLINSIASVYFLQQAKRLKPLSVYGIEVVNMSNLIFFYISAKEELHKEGRNYNRMLQNKEKLFRGVKEALIHAIIYCVVAALVEKSRLSVIRKHGLAYRPDHEIIPMTIFWFFPQAFVLGRFYGILERIVRISLAEEMPLPMRNLKKFVFDGFVGVGIISGVVVVYLVGKVSEMGGGANWFQHDTENRRLDLFYWVLTVLCILVFIRWK